MKLAQATGQPYSGANSAHDFQPPTRNPQDEAVPTQPQNGNLQNPLNMEALSNQNLNIIVPSSGGQSKAAVAARTQQIEVAEAKSGAGDVVAIALLVMAVFIITAFALHRRQRSVTQNKEIEADPATKPEKTMSKKTSKKSKKSKSKKKKKK